MDDRSNKNAKPERVVARLWFLSSIVPFLLFSIFANASDADWGIWTNSENNITFTFARNNEFSYSTKFKDAKPVTVEGAWQTQEGACWTGEKKENVGNVMIYVDTHQCCLSAQMLGRRLILSHVWHKGELYKPGFCDNQVLQRRGFTGLDREP